MERLFVYGSLQPGGTNAYMLEGIRGRWVRGVLRGRLLAAGWGAGIGYPGLVLDAAAGQVSGHVLESLALGDHWALLDEFEGDDYQRRIVPVTLESGRKVDAHVYVVRNP
jgi:gamma-glutamylcyclotransferase (GGCT)/AIG2-like uncharacterized protein YtfP